MIFVPSPRASTTTTVKTVMCDVSALILAGLAGLSKEMQSLPTVESPRISNNQGDQNGTWSTVDRVNQRMSMPVQLQSRLNGHFEQSSSSPSRLGISRGPGTSSPIASEETSRSATPNGLDANSSRPGSAAGSHDHSRERTSVQALSGMTPSERRKSRTRGRIQIVVGSFYLHAGRWPDALRELVDGATMARANNDYLWHARGLEYILLCLLLFGWAGSDFQVSSQNMFGKAV